MRKITFLLFVLLIFLTLVPRSVDLLSGNYLFGFDQGRDYLAVRNIVVNHKFTLIGSEIGGGFAGFQGIFHGPFHYYFLSIPFLILDGSPYGGIVLTFIYGLSAIILGFYLGKKLFGTIWGLITALLIAISPPLISQSRFVWNTHGAPIFILLAFYYLYKFIYGGSKHSKFIFLSSFFSGFVYNFQLGIALPMCLALLISSYLVLRLRKISQYVALFLGFVLSFLPMILFELRHGLVLKGIKGYFDHGETAVTLKFVELILKDHLGTFLYNFSDTFPRQELASGEFMVIIFAILVFFFLLKEKNMHLKHFFIYLLLLPFSSFFIFSFLRGAVYTYYLTSLNFVYILLFVYIFYSVYRYKNPILRLSLTAFFVFLLINASASASRVFWNDYFDYGGTAKIKGKIDALDYIYKDAQGEEFNVLVFTPPVYDYAYRYLLTWYGEKKYGYVPGDKKEGLFYLWIEPEPGKPWTYKGWLETVIKTGKILKEEELPSGFIIQKRYGET